MTGLDELSAIRGLGSALDARDPNASMSNLMKSLVSRQSSVATNASTHEG
jgi:hypothetical protein